MSGFSRTNRIPQPLHKLILPRSNRLYNMANHRRTKMYLASASSHLIRWNDRRTRPKLGIRFHHQRSLATIHHIPCSSSFGFLLLRIHNFAFFFLRASQHYQCQPTRIHRTHRPDKLPQTPLQTIRHTTHSTVLERETGKLILALGPSPLTKKGIPQKVRHEVCLHAVEVHHRGMAILARDNNNFHFGGPPR